MLSDDLIGLSEKARKQEVSELVGTGAYMARHAPMQGMFHP